MALFGIIGTAVSFIIVMIAVSVSHQFLSGTFRFGVSIVTPFAMVMCMITVTKKQKRMQAELRAAEKAKGLIRSGGDL